MIAVSYLKSKFKKAETIRLIDESNADLIHVDLMDGLYVQDKNFTIDEVINDLKNTQKPLDIHLMVKNPEIYIRELALLKPFAITFHLNSTENPKDVIELIKDYNMSPAQITRLKRNHNINTHTISRLCQILDCRIEDICEYIEDN